MEFIRTATLFVIEPICKGAKDLAELFFYLAPVLALAGIVYWIFSA